MRFSHLQSTAAGALPAGQLGALHILLCLSAGRVVRHLAKETGAKAGRVSCSAGGGSCVRQCWDTGASMTGPVRGGGSFGVGVGVDGGFAGLWRMGCTVLPAKV